MTYSKEERYEIRYEVPTAGGDWKQHVARGTSKDWLSRNKAKCKELGYRVISAGKLYPFSTMKNQHNFDLIHNIVMNELYEIWYDGKKVSDEEYEKLESLKERSEKYFSLELPVAWLPYEDWKDAKELSEMAIIHRQNACIANGRPDLVTYC